MPARFNLRSLTVRLSNMRSASRASVLRMLAREDFDVTALETLNSESLQSLLCVSAEGLEARVSPLYARADDAEGLAATLAEHGIAVVPQALPDGTVDEIREELQAVANRYETELEDRRLFEDDRALAQRGLAEVSGYRDLAGFPKPVVELREGQDAGMVDIFNVDRLLTETGATARRPFESPSIIQAIAASANQAFTVRNLNAYLNAGISTTRGFHVDAYTTQFKAFIYLTDVSKLEDGPYTYVKGSHLPSVYRSLNQGLAHLFPSPTEAPIVPSSKVVPILAPRGSMVISNQAGFHRGLPQTRDAKRVLLTMKYGSAAE